MDGEETQVLSSKLIGPTFHHCVLFPLKLECHLPLSVNIKKMGHSFQHCTAVECSSASNL